MTDIVLSQILSVRASGLVNMLDVYGVQRLAYELEYHELVCYIEEDAARYFHFILYGQEKKATQ